MGIVAYKDFVAFVPEIEVTFGSTTTDRLLKTVEAFADGLSLTTTIKGPGPISYAGAYPSDAEIIAAASVVNNELFMCPLPLGEDLVFDGPAFGNVTVYMYVRDTNRAMAFTKCTVDIVELDSTGAEASIAGETTIWEGLKKGHTSATYTLPFWIEIDELSVPRESRLALRVKTYGASYGLNSNTGTYYHNLHLKVDPGAKQLFVSLPVVVSA